MKREYAMSSTFHNTYRIGIEIVPDEPEKYMILDAELKEFDTLIEAMKYQAAKNEVICDLIVAKDRNFETSVKLSDPKEAWNWKK